MYSVEYHTYSDTVFLCSNFTAGSLCKGIVGSDRILYVAKGDCMFIYNSKNTILSFVLLINHCISSPLPKKTHSHQCRSLMEEEIFHTLRICNRNECHGASLHIQDYRITSFVFIQRETGVNIKMYKRGYLWLEAQLRS